MKTAHALEPLGYVPAIDGLRAIAVLSVLAFHVRPQLLPGGSGGVDVFFVISGFVVTASMAGPKGAGARAGIATFYARRLVRIVPALLVMLLCTWLLAVLFVSERSLLWAGAGTGAAAFFGAANLQLTQAPTGYYDPGSAMNPFLHTWTLGVEEQFYLIFPLILWLVGRDPGRETVPWRALAVVALASLGSLLAYAALSARAPNLAFYLMPTRFWELGAGVVLCLAMPLWLDPLGRLGKSAAGFLWALCFFALAWFLVRAPGPHLHIPPLVLPVGGTMGLTALSCARRASWPTRLLAARGPVLIGLLSYSLYLWHWPVLALMRWTFGLDTPAKLAAALLAIAAATALSYRFVERPVRNAFRSGALTRRQALVAGPVALVAGAVTAALLFTVHPQLGGISDFDRAPPPPDGGCVRAVPRSRLGDAVVEGWQPCGGNRSTLFVIGDSHAAAYEPMTGRYAARTGRRVVIYYSLGCEFPPLALAGSRLRDCARFHATAVRQVAQAAGPGDVVLMASLHLGHAGDPALSAGERRAGWRQSIRLLSALAATGARLVLEAPKPVFASPPNRCTDWFNRSNPVCSAGFKVARGALLERRAPVLAEIRALAAPIPNAVLWDPFPILCPGDPCSAGRPGRWLFRDQDHLMPLANRLLLPSFTAAADAPRIGGRPAAKDDRQGLLPGQGPAAAHPPAD
ncbi:MAG TPA: acyltransferase family protein [Allosphingosinicella sp.]